jgi:hypothetical protein
MSEEKDLVEGFNAGYIIEKHRPELAKQLLSAVDGVELPLLKALWQAVRNIPKKEHR